MNKLYLLSAPLLCLSAVASYANSQSNTSSKQIVAVNLTEADNRAQIQLERIERLQRQQKENNLSSQNLILEHLLDEDLIKDLTELDNTSREKLAVLLSITFHNLYYDYNLPQTDQLREIIKKYQNDLEQPATGKMTADQFNELLNRHEAIQSKKIKVLEMNDEDISFENTIDYFHTKGTLSMLNENHAFPINIADIECYRESELCMMKFAYVSDLFMHKDYYLQLDSYNYDIISWDDTEIIATTSHICKTEELRINLKERRTYQIATNRDSDTCNRLANKPEKLEKPITSVLVPGYIQTEQYWEKEKTIKSDYYSSTFKEIIQRLK